MIEYTNLSGCPAQLISNLYALLPCTPGSNPSKKTLSFPRLIRDFCFLQSSRASPIVSCL